MKDIYKQHEVAFQQVAAYVILKDSERVATIAFKFPRDGAGRLYAYVHWFGLEMVRGHANGYGYDKKSAACESAAEKLLAVFKAPREPRERQHLLDAGFEAFNTALQNVGGETWETKLRNAGFTVFQAV